MNSGRPQDEVQPFGDWLAKAKRRWTNARITGCGPYALVELSTHWTDQHVLLFESFETAKCQSRIFKRSEIVDLAAPPVNLANADAQAEREDRRAKKKQADLRAVGFSK